MTFVAPRDNQTYHPRVYAAFGFTIDDDPATWVWTNITKYVRNNADGTYGPITMTGGRPALSGTSDPSQISLMLDNTDGRFTARSPFLRDGITLNPYWPNVVVNTPIKVAATWDGAVTEYELLTSFAIGWPQQPNAGLINVTIPLTAQGRLRVMRRSTQTIDSAMFKAVTLENGINYDGYWPMEDGPTATRFAHGPVQDLPLVDMSIPGIPRVTPAGIDTTMVPGSKPIPDFSKGAHCTATVTQVNTGTGIWTVDHVLFVGDTPSGSGLVPLTRSFFANGSFQVSMDLTQTEWQVDYFDLSGAGTTVMTADWGVGISPFDNNPHLIELVAVQSGSDIQLELNVDGVNQALGTKTGVGQANITKIGVAGTVTGFPLGIGHLVCWNRSIAFDNTDAMRGFVGETAIDRVFRLCNDYNIGVTELFGTVPSQKCGPQLIDTLANNLDSIADLDNALLHDAGPNGNLVYASGSYRYNRPTDMTLDYTSHQIGDAITPTYDDQNLVNQWTISRTNGSSYTYTEVGVGTTGVLYASTDTVNCETDDQLDDIAGWRTNLSTFPGYRLPTLTINMRTTPELAEGALTLEMPFHISPVRIPQPFPVESLDQFVEAFSTQFDSVTWETTYSCTPYGPWQVAVYGTSRYDVNGTVLTAAETQTSTDVTVTPATANDWTVLSASMPFQVQVDQEVMLVADVNNGTSIMPFDGTFEASGIAAQWTPFSGTFAVDTVHVNHGKFAGKFVVTGTPTSTGVRNTTAVAAVAGNSYWFTFWAFSTSLINNFQGTIGWQNASHASISDSNTTLTLQANLWTKIVVHATAPALTAFATFGPTMSSSPATGTTAWFDDVTLTHVVGADGSTQTMTVYRGNAGIQSPHPIGSSVHIYPPSIYAL